MTDVVIAAYRRSPFHLAHKGELTKVRPDEMAAQVVRALVGRDRHRPARRSRTWCSAAPSPRASRG